MTSLERRQHALKPASVQEFGVAIDRLFQFARTFGIAPDNVADMTSFYRQALDDVPADMVREAVDNIIRTWKWGKKMPMPADLRERVEKELTLRRIELQAEQRRQVERPVQVRLTEEERGTPEERAAFVAALKATLPVQETAE